MVVEILDSVPFIIPKYWYIPKFGKDLNVLQNRDKSNKKNLQCCQSGTQGVVQYITSAQEAGNSAV